LSPIRITLKKLSAPATRRLKSAHHQNSGRVARPVNSAYLRKTVLMASPNDRASPRSIGRLHHGGT
jgi:hypothetical protein